MVGSLLGNNYMYVTYRVGQRIRSIIVTAVYRKCLALSGLSRHKFPPGVIINHMAVDPTVMVELVPTIHLLWAAPFEIIVCLVILIAITGWSAIVGVFIMLLATPVNMVLTRGLYMARISSLQHKDTRIKLLTEVLNAIKTVKLMVWEAHLHGQLNDSRRQEVNYLFKFIFLRSLMIVVIWCIPLLGTLATFVCLLFIAKRQMTVEVAFMCVVIYNQLNVPLIRLPKLLNDFVLSLVSLKRITAFLVAQEIQPDNVDNHVFNPAIPAVAIDHATFTWEDTDKPALSDTSLSIPHGQLVAVIGQVGSGKTALLRALLGSIKRTAGRAVISGQLAYAAQNPWIQNISFRSNVTFGKEFDGEWYEKVVTACELKRDITLLTGGDTAEIGEAGSTLSGGQKQRLALARAVYQDADIYLLDDTLSAVDANVGENIFNNCIRGLLAGKTRILVTQQFQYLNRVDYILVMRNGEVVERGTYAELLANKDSEFARLNSNYEAQIAHAEEKTEAKGGDGLAIPGGVAVSGEGALMQLEEHQKGSVPWSCYWTYVREGKWPLFIVTMLCFVASTIAAIYSNYWLAEWTASENERLDSSSSSGGAMSTKKGILVYSLIVAGTCILMIFRFLFLSINNMNASKGIHNKTL
jgi:ABC-type multidrug transport system fused ATPase/permease subunit